MMFIYSDYYFIYFLKFIFLFEVRKTDFGLICQCIGLIWYLQLVSVLCVYFDALMYYKIP